MAPAPVRHELAEDLTDRTITRCVPLLARDDVPEHVRSLTSSRVLDVEADRWGVTTGHRANLRHQGEGIGYLKIGSRVAYRYCDVVAFETEHYVSPVTAS